MYNKNNKRLRLIPTEAVMNIRQNTESNKNDNAGLNVRQSHDDGDTIGLVILRAPE